MATAPQYACPLCGRTAKPVGGGQGYCGRCGWVALPVSKTEDTRAMFDHLPAAQARLALQFCYDLDALPPPDRAGILDAVLSTICRQCGRDRTRPGEGPGCEQCGNPQALGPAEMVSEHVRPPAFAP